MVDKKFSLTPEECSRLSEFLAHFGNQLRLRIICKLYRGPKCVGEIVEETGQRQSTVSGQLKYLSMVGITRSTRHGTRIYYELADKRASDLLKHLVKTFGLEAV